MTRHTFLPLMVLCWFAVLSISCGTAVLPVNEQPTEQSSLSQPLKTMASSSAIESTDNKDDSTDNKDDSTDNKVDAEAVLKNALARATAEDKSVLIHLGAPW